MRLFHPLFSLGLASAALAVTTHRLPFKNTTNTNVSTSINYLANVGQILLVSGRCDCWDPACKDPRCTECECDNPECRKAKCSLCACDDEDCRDWRCTQCNCHEPRNECRDYRCPAKCDCNDPKCVATDPRCKRCECEDDWCEDPTCTPCDCWDPKCLYRKCRDCSCKDPNCRDLKCASCDCKKPDCRDWRCASCNCHIPSCVDKHCPSAISSCPDPTATVTVPKTITIPSGTTTTTTTVPSPTTTTTTATVPTTTTATRSTTTTTTVTVTSGGPTQPTIIPTPTPDPCSRTGTLVQVRRFLRIYDVRWDHFYAVDASDVSWALANLYVEETIYATPGQLYLGQHAGAVPIYRCRYISSTPPAIDHLLTLSQAEYNSTGCVNGRIIGYVYDQQICGAHPLYRAYSSLHYDHFYTPDRAEYDRALAGLNYVDEGITGYFL